MPTVSNLIAAIENTYPLSRAESWDKVGLQVGDGNAQVGRVLVAHEATDATIEEAADCQTLVVYHPLIFRPLENLNFRDHTARLAARCIARGLSLIAVHTALDNAPPPRALGDRLAAELGLRDVRVLRPSGHEALDKIVVFTPPEALDAVSAAMWEAGAGHIGNYDQASFRARGTGTFRPLEGADPYSGTIGKLEQVDEWRLEAIVPRGAREEVLRAMIAAHPYEEVAYDIYSLENRAGAFGSARVGSLDEAMSLDDFARRVERDLRAPGIRVVAGKPAVQTVACVPGSGASYLDAAVGAGCDCLVTGDIKHHDALKARALGIAVIDATHAATERAAVDMMAAVIEGVPGVDVARSAIDTNPFGKLAN